MQLRIPPRLRHALRSATPAEESVHFHIGWDGEPHVCDLPRCESPGLTVGEATRRS